MSETKNYGFTLEDNSATYFKNWREAINGVSNSNFIKVDEILANKGDKSVSAEYTLAASSWVGTTPPYTQELLVTGLTSDQNGSIAVSHSATFEQREAVRNAMLTITGQSDGVLVISADGELPTIDIPVMITLS